MPTATLPTRTPTERENTSLSRGLILALGLHALAFAALFAYAFIAHRASRHWGDTDPTAGAIQASMVSALPLPPRQRFLDKAVLASDNPSAAPTPPPPAKSLAAATPAKSSPPPKPDEVLIPTKTPPKPAPSLADRLEAEVNKRKPTAAPPPTPKATTGDTAGIQIPQSVTQLKNGTASLTVDERTFGDRYAWYIRLISQKINQSKQQDSDPPEARGKHTAIRFTIDRDGAPTDASVVTRSGSAALDTSTLRAIQRIDTFGPLPAGDHLTVRFEYDAR